jgi:signal transduction histidine kinase
MGSAPGGVDAAVLPALLEVSADGLGVLDDDGRLRSVNAAGAGLLGRPAAELLGRPLPFAADAPDPGGVPGGRALASWTAGDGRRRTLEYRLQRQPDGTAVLWFRDVTDVLRQQERLTAIARAAASVADERSLRATLDAVAREVVMTANIGAVQILTLDDPRDELRVLGMAGFGNAADFPERLSACRRLGAHLRFMDALRTGRPIVDVHRKAAIMTDPRWAPLHEVMGEPEWDSFVAMPLTVRGRTVGVINAYYLPGEDPGPSSLSFLEAMADHAAVAVDTAALLAQTRSRAESEERRRLARDLHDSVVQQLFSMRMQAGALSARLEHGDVDPVRVRAAAQELAELSQSALADLRGLVFELRPLELADRGLLEAVRDHAAGVEARTGLLIEVRSPGDLELTGDLDVQEDLYRIVQEALHNVVKHAGATGVEVRFAAAEPGLVVEVTDDGGGEVAEPGLPGARRRTLGLASMRERAERWGGRFSAGPRAGGGWAVTVSLPLPHARADGGGRG